MFEQERPSVPVLSRIETGLSILELCAAVNRAAAKRIQMKMLRIGLSSAAYNLIEAVGTRDDMTLSQAAKVLRVDIASLSSLSVRLERDGFLERIPSPNDKRSQLLKLTEKVAAVKVQADEIMKMEATDATHKLSEKEQLHIVKSLDHILRNLEPPEEKE